VLASYNLYELLFNRIEANPNHHVGEIGCGRGLGCVHFFNVKKPARIVGVDLNPMQIERARSLHNEIVQQNSKRLEFIVGAADQTGLASKSLDVVYSLEAAQHFPSFENFAKEVDRILKANGQFVVCTFFAQKAGLNDQLKSIFATVEPGIDFSYPVE
jgi:ubiquinone/menaquinone biosynthesis C-methylase UbiE